jgi:hypothetical protein
MMRVRSSERDGKGHVHDTFSLSSAAMDRVTGIKPLSVAFENHRTSARTLLTLRAVFPPEGNVVAVIQLEPRTSTAIFPSSSSTASKPEKNSETDESKTTTTTSHHGNKTTITVKNSEKDTSISSSSASPSSSTSAKPPQQGIIIARIERSDASTSSSSDIRSSTSTVRDTNTATTTAMSKGRAISPSRPSTGKRWKPEYFITVAQGFDVALACAVWMAGVEGP